MLLANSKSGGIVPLTTCVCVTGNKSYYTKGTSALDVENCCREFANNIYHEQTPTGQSAVAI
jgi:hypothetical protein